MSPQAKRRVSAFREGERAREIGNELEKNKRTLGTTSLPNFTILASLHSNLLQSIAASLLLVDIQQSGVASFLLAPRTPKSWLLIKWTSRKIIRGAASALHIPEKCPRAAGAPTRYADFRLHISNFRYIPLRVLCVRTSQDGFILHFSFPPRPRKPTATPSAFYFNHGSRNNIYGFTGMACSQPQGW